MKHSAFNLFPLLFLSYFKLSRSFFILSLFFSPLFSFILVLRFYFFFIFLALFFFPHSTCWQVPPGPGTGPVAGIDRPGGDMPNQPTTLPKPDPTLCWALCNKTAGCVGWNYAVPNCDAYFLSPQPRKKKKRKKRKVGEGKQETGGKQENQGIIRENEGKRRGEEEVNRKR
jgi:hypothetical protein